MPKKWVVKAYPLSFEPLCHFSSHRVRKGLSLRDPFPAVDLTEGLTTLVGQ